MRKSNSRRQVFASAGPCRHEDPKQYNYICRENKKLTNNKRSEKGMMGRRDQASDSAFDSSQSNSQFLFSQVDFQESQDFMSGPSQTPVDAKISPGQKFYNRYKSRGLLFPKDSQSLEGTKGRTSFKEKIAANKVAAKERDDREIIGSIFGVIRESTYELKQAINVVQENLKEGNSSRNELKEHITKVEENLSRHTEKFLDNLSTRDQMKDEICQLKKKLTEKETEVSKMKDQLKEAKSNQLKVLKDQLYKMHQEHKSWLTQHLDDLTSQQKELLEETSGKQHNYTQQQGKNIKKIETMLKKHVDNHAKQNKSDQNKYQRWFNELQETNEHASTVQDSLVKDLKDLKTSYRNDMGSLIKQQDQLRSLYQQHRTAMEKFVKEQLQLTKDSSTEIRDLVDHICRETLPSIIRQEQQPQEVVNQRLQQEVEHQRLPRTNSKDCDKTSVRFSDDSTRVYPKAQKVDIKFTERTTTHKNGFCSPLTPLVKTWDTKVLFSKRNSGLADFPKSASDDSLSGTAVGVAGRTRMQMGNSSDDVAHTRSRKRGQDALMDSPDFSCVVNQHRTSRSTGQRVLPSADPYDSKKLSTRVASAVKVEPMSPNARWMQAMSVKTNSRTANPTKVMEHSKQLDSQDAESEFSSPSLSMSEFFFTTRKPETSNDQSKRKGSTTKGTKRRKKSCFQPKKRSGKK